MSMFQEDNRVSFVTMNIARNDFAFSHPVRAILFRANKSGRRNINQPILGIF